MTESVGMAGNRTAAGRASFSERIEAIAWTRTYDVLVRVPFIAWFLFLEFATITHLTSYIDARGAVPDALFFTNVLARVAVILFLATWVAFVMLRSAPKRKTPGLWPRFAAFLGSFVMMALPLFPAHELSLGTSILSTMLIFAGDGFAVYVVFWLGRSVSLMPEARKLVTRGPYAVIRHPLYAAEEAAVVGTFLQFASPWTTLILVVHALIQIQRMGYEEQVLHQSFPEYGDYASRTARLIPGLY